MNGLVAFLLERILIACGWLILGGMRSSGYCPPSTRTMAPVVNDDIGLAR